MVIRYFEKGFNYSEDGPGNRLVYHLSGCNLTCPWCSNPEGMTATGGKECSVDEIFREILSARSLFFDGGGVTFTGGECTLQSEALCALIPKLRQEGISVAIESNAATRGFLSVASLCDVVFADCKHVVPERLREGTGADFSLYYHNITAVLVNNYLHFRIPLVHGFNDSDASLSAFLAFFGKLDRDRFDVELLPYHEYGKEKWQKCGKTYTVTDGKVSTDAVRTFTEAFRAAGITVART